MDNFKQVDPYCYPNSNIFINKHNIKNEKALEIYAGTSSFMRITELLKSPILGDHSLKHWQKIHEYIFQDTYSWAGQLRQISLFEEYSNPYAKPEMIESGYKNLIVPCLERTNHFRNSSTSNLVKDIAILMGELYYIHPFRDGNSRSLTQFVKTIGLNAGIIVDLSGFTDIKWADFQHGIVKAAHERDTRLLENTLEGCITRNQDLLNTQYQEKSCIFLEAQEDSLLNTKTTHQHLLETAKDYGEQLKTYLTAKETQVTTLETKLNTTIGQQKDKLKQTEKNRPGLICSLWRGAAWESQKQAQRVRLSSLENRLSLVKYIGREMTGKRLLALATKKLERHEPELVAKHKEQENLKIQKQQLAMQQKLEKEKKLEKSQSLGMTRTIGR